VEIKKQQEDIDLCTFNYKIEKMENNTSSFDNWLNDLEDAKQPTCNIDNPDDCEACGS
jgi:hypothetical protein